MSPSSLDARVASLTPTIEFAIISIYRSRPEMTDKDVIAAIERLLETYQARLENRQYTPPSPTGVIDELYGMVLGMCEWRMGTGVLVDEDDEPIENTLELVTVADVVACLRIMHRNIRFWARQSVTQTEYLTFTSRFMR